MTSSGCEAADAALPTVASTAAGAVAGAVADAAAGGAPGDVAVVDVAVVDVAVVGAGPAGMAAAVAAADAGASVVLVDAELGPGGQFWRHPVVPNRWAGDGTGSAGGAGVGAAAGGIERGVGAAGAELASSEISALHHDLATYRELLRRMGSHRSGGMLEYLPGHEVWSLFQRGVRSGETFGPQFVINALHSADGRPAERRLLARALVLATGAYDLQIPFPGWDLPGVMTAGGVQSLLKGHGVLAGRRSVVAGTGPFLFSVATGLARSGGQVLGVYEAASPVGWRGGAGAVLRNPGKVREGVGYAGLMVRHRVPFHPRSTVVRADGDQRLRSVTVAPLDRAGRPVHSRARRIDVDVLAVGWGFVPQLELPLSLGCASRPGPDGIPVIAVGQDQRSSVPGVYIAGETCGVGGATLAVVEGRIAGAAASAAALGAAASIAGRDLLHRRRKTLRAFASAMAKAHPVPSHWMANLPDDTVVCRCEEVTAGAIRQVVRRDGATDARTAKLLARPGMGWCQGRVCGYSTSCLTAGGSPPAHTAVERPVAVPIPLSVVAGDVDSGPGPAGTS